MQPLNTTTDASHCPGVYLYKRVVQAKLFIDRNFSEQINLDDISDEAHFSKFHFIRLFKDCYGKTPHQYLAWVRIENAKLLLRQRCTVNETCFTVGYDSVTSFAGLFKKMTGTSPSAYQKGYEQRQQQLANQPLQFIPGCFARQKGWLE